VSVILLCLSYCCVCHTLADKIYSGPEYNCRFPLDFSENYTICIFKKTCCMYLLTGIGKVHSVSSFLVKDSESLVMTCFGNRDQRYAVLK
jgi:hypothetical protein